MNAQRAADDFDVIRAEMQKLRKLEAAFLAKRCAIREGGVVQDCWCHKAAANGGNLPCPPQEPSPAVEDCT